MAIPYNCIGIAIADEVNRDKYTCYNGGFFFIIEIRWKGELSFSVEKAELDLVFLYLTGKTNRGI